MNSRLPDLPYAGRASLHRGSIKHRAGPDTGSTIGVSAGSKSRQDVIAASIRGWDDYTSRTEAAKKGIPAGESAKLTRAK